MDKLNFNKNYIYIGLRLILLMGMLTKGYCIDELVDEAIEKITELIRSLIKIGYVLAVLSFVAALVNSNIDHQYKDKVKSIAKWVCISCGLLAGITHLVAWVGWDIELDL